MSKYSKAIAAAVGALTQLGVVIVDNEVTNQEWLSVILAALTVLGVYQVRNVAGPTPPADATGEPLPPPF